MVAKADDNLNDSVRTVFLQEQSRSWIMTAHKVRLTTLE